MIDDTTLMPEVSPDIQPEPQESQQEAQQQAEAPKESSEERNFRNLREKADRIQKERDEALLRLRQYEASQKSESDTLNLKPDDLAEGKHINKVEKQIKQLEHQLMLANLRAQYPDIDKVVNDQNLAILNEKYPHLARTISSSTNLYDQALTAYDAIRDKGIYQDQSAFEADRAIAHKNAAKPKPLASVSAQQGDSPMSRANAFANGLTDDLRKQLHKEMVEAIRNRN